MLYSETSAPSTESSRNAVVSVPRAFHKLGACLRSACCILIKQAVDPDVIGETVRRRLAYIPSRLCIRHSRLKNSAEPLSFFEQKLLR